ncbi:MAG: methyltransferase, TIGR04325 family [Acidobacteriia bacterium]|nr:methyltransferase, TIGR04325 family [Terriglobia bacterium]
MSEALALGGHEDPSLSENHSRTLRESDYPVLHWLRTIGARRILDFGGSIGSLYYLYQNRLTPLPQEWLVCDLPCVAARGEELAVSRAACNLHFTSVLAEGSHCDVLLASGALHFWPKPVSCLFDEIGALAPHVLINRSPLTERASYAMVHGLPKIAVPAWVRNSRELIAEMEALGYTLIDRWLEPSRSLSFPLFPEHTVSAFSGLYFRRNSSHSRQEEIWVERERIGARC